MREYMFNSATARYVCDELANFIGVETLCTFEDSRDIPLKERTDRANAWGADAFVSIHANAMGNVWDESGVGIETFTYVTKPADSVKLAAIVNANLVAETGRPNRGVKSADFHVLRETHMTAILCECGFMTSRTEAALLKTDDYRRKCTKAIVDGLAECYGLKRKVIAEEVAPTNLSVIDANKIIGFLKAGYGATSDKEAQAEFKRLANELRKVSGQATQ
jgi:N-acetylmuramoyl-L-alanine amidase